jgi:hypothetical protein
MANSTSPLAAESLDTAASMPRGVVEERGKEKRAVQGTSWAVFLWGPSGLCKFDMYAKYSNNTK